MSDVKPGAVVFVYPYGADDPDKAYPAIVCAVHAQSKSPTLLDLMVFGWHGSPIIDAPAIPYLPKWDEEAVRPFALAAPHEKEMDSKSKRAA